MSKAFPRPRLRTIESRNRLANGVSSRSKDVAGDPYLDPRLLAAIVADRKSAVRLRERAGSASRLPRRRDAREPSANRQAARVRHPEDRAEGD
jgi:hypothetical protein